MYVATLVLELGLRDVATLREKRRLMQAILEKLHRHFNASVAEVGALDRPAAAVLGAAAVGPSRREAREVLERVADVLNLHPLVEVHRIEFRDV